jgi:hypothetical protein
VLMCAPLYVSVSLTLRRALELSGNSVSSFITVRVAYVSRNYSPRHATHLPAVFVILFADLPSSRDRLCGIVARAPGC